MNEFYDELKFRYGDYFVTTLKEIIEEIPVEYNDFIYFCKKLKIKDYSADIPYLYLNQHLVRDEVYEKFNLKLYNV